MDQSTTILLTQLMVLILALSNLMLLLSIKKLKGSLMITNMAVGFIIQDVEYLKDKEEPTQIHDPS
jgi:hypothetical protein